MALGEEALIGEGLVVGGANWAEVIKLFAAVIYECL